MDQEVGRSPQILDTISLISETSAEEEVSVILPCLNQSSRTLYKHNREGSPIIPIQAFNPDPHNDSSDDANTKIDDNNDDGLASQTHAAPLTQWVSEIGSAGPNEGSICKDSYERDAVGVSTMSKTHIYDLPQTTSRSPVRSIAKRGEIRMNEIARTTPSNKSNNSSYRPDGLPRKMTETNEKAACINQQIIMMAVNDIAAAVSKHMDCKKECLIMEGIRQIYRQPALSGLPNKDKASVVERLETVIREVNRRQREEKSNLADRVKRGGMTTAEKSRTKQQLEALARRCADLHNLFRMHQDFKSSAAGLPDVTMQQREKEVNIQQSESEVNSQQTEPAAGMEDDDLTQAPVDVDFTSNNQMLATAESLSLKSREAMEVQDDDDDKMLDNGNFPKNIRDTHVDQSGESDRDIDDQDIRPTQLHDIDVENMTAPHTQPRGIDEQDFGMTVRPTQPDDIDEQDMTVPQTPHDINVENTTVPQTPHDIDEQDMTVPQTPHDTDVENTTAPQTQPHDIDDQDMTVRPTQQPHDDQDFDMIIPPTHTHIDTNRNGVGESRSQQGRSPPGSTIATPDHSQALFGCDSDVSSQLCLINSDPATSDQRHRQCIPKSASSKAMSESSSEMSQSILKKTHPALKNQQSVLKNHMSESSSEMSQSILKTHQSLLKNQKPVLKNKHVNNVPDLTLKTRAKEKTANDDNDDHDGSVDVFVSDDSDDVPDLTLKTRAKEKSIHSANDDDDDGSVDVFVSDNSEGVPDISLILQAKEKTTHNTNDDDDGSVDVFVSDDSDDQSEVLISSFHTNALGNRQQTKNIEQKQQQQKIQQEAVNSSSAQTCRTSSAINPSSAQAACKPTTGRKRTRSASSLSDDSDEGSIITRTDISASNPGVLSSSTGLFTSTAFSAGTVLSASTKPSHALHNDQRTMKPGTTADTTSTLKSKQPKFKAPFAMISNNKASSVQQFANTTSLPAKAGPKNTAESAVKIIVIKPPQAKSVGSSSSLLPRPRAVSVARNIESSPQNTVTAAVSNTTTLQFTTVSRTFAVASNRNNDPQNTVASAVTNTTTSRFTTGSKPTTTTSAVANNSKNNPINPSASAGTPTAARDSKNLPVPQNMYVTTTTTTTTTTTAAKPSAVNNSDNGQKRFVPNVTNAARRPCIDNGQKSFVPTVNNAARRQCSDNGPDFEDDVRSDSAQVADSFSWASFPLEWPATVRGSGRGTKAKVKAQAGQDLQSGPLGVLKTFRQLLSAGLISAGNHNLSLCSSGVEKKANVLSDGRVQDEGGLTFPTPVAWFKAVTGNTTSKRLLAYKQITYNGRSLADISKQASAAASPSLTPPRSSSPPPTQPLNSRPQYSTPQTQIRQLPSPWQGTVPTPQTQSQPQSHNQSQSHFRDSPDWPSILSKLRKVELVADCEVTSHAACQELRQFWNARFADVTMSQAFWDSVDDWD